MNKHPICKVSSLSENVKEVKKVMPPQVSLISLFQALVKAKTMLASNLQENFKSQSPLLAWLLHFLMFFQKKEVAAIC